MSGWTPQFKLASLSCIPHANNMLHGTRALWQKQDARKSTPVA